MHNSVLVLLNLHVITKSLDSVFIVIPRVCSHFGKHLVTSICYLFDVLIVYILGQLPAFSHVDGVGSLHAILTNETVINQIAIKVNAIDQNMKVWNARFRVVMKTGKYLGSAQVDAIFLLAVLARPL